ncbi:MAG: ROK family protein [Clostridia bacterium]|nr:ROK family protein [Clostridia bacterium]
MIRIGIDVGGTGIKIGVVDENGHILASEAIPTRIDLPFSEQITQMADCAKRVLAESGFTIDDVQSIGAGVPGVADKNGVVIFCNNLAWVNVPFRTEFQKHILKPIYIDNDATVAGLAESVAGVSAGTSSSVFVTLGTGVGAGIVIGGKVWSGAHGIGSEIGHITMMLDGEPCNCGNRGCLERYCSATAIIRMARVAVAEHPESLILSMAEGDPAKINARIVIDAARVEDPVAVQVYQKYISYLAQAVNSIINFLDPEIIVIGGGVSKAGDFLLTPLRQEVPKYAMYKSVPSARIEMARLGADAGIIGAAMLG